MGVNCLDLERMDKGPVEKKFIRKVTLEEVRKIIHVGNKFVPIFGCGRQAMLKKREDFEVGDGNENFCRNNEEKVEAKMLDV